MKESNANIIWHRSCVLEGSKMHILLGVSRRICTYDSRTLRAIWGVSHHILSYSHRQISRLAYWLRKRSPIVLKNCMKMAGSYKGNLHLTSKSAHMWKGIGGGYGLLRFSEIYQNFPNQWSPRSHGAIRVNHSERQSTQDTHIQKISFKLSGMGHRHTLPAWRHI